MADAYRSATGEGPEPRETALYYYIQRYGADAVMGRPMGAGEIRRMTLVTNIVAAYRSREKAPNWAEWAEKNRDANELLNRSMEYADVSDS